jgi:hypothetical protein
MTEMSGVRNGSPWQTLWRSACPGANGEATTLLEFFGMPLAWIMEM